MSVTLMAKVFPLEIPTTEKIVLLALADSANDEDAQTWIPIRRKSVVARLRADGTKKLDLMMKTSLGIRAIQNALRSLEEAGHLTRLEIAGKGVIYTIHPRLVPIAQEEEADHGARGAPDAPRSKCGAHVMTPRGAPDAPKTEVTIKSLGGVAPGPDAGEDARATLTVTPDFWDKWEAFLEMRRGKKKTVNATSASTLFRTLVRLAREGHDPSAVVEQSTANLWNGFWPIKDERDERLHGNDHHHHRGEPSFGNPMVSAAARHQGAGTNP